MGEQSAFAIILSIPSTRGRSRRIDRTSVGCPIFIGISCGMVTPRLPSKSTAKIQKIILVPVS